METNGQDNRQSLLAYSALGLGLLLLGLSAILVRLADVPGTIAAFYRVAIAVVVVAPFALGESVRNGLPAWSDLRFALLAGVFFAGDLAAWSAGVMLSGATNPTLMANTAPLWVGLGAVFIFRERLGRRFWLGLTVALAGAAVVFGLDAVRSFEVGLGTLLGLMAGLFYGGYFLLTQRGRAKIRLILFYWFSIVANVAVLFVLNLALGYPFFGYSMESYGFLLALALGPQVVGWLLINYAQGHLPASLVSPTLLGQPVVTAAFAAVLLAEPLFPLQILGGAAVLFGVFLVHRSQQALRPVHPSRLENEPSPTSD
ncbi:MAG: DMT family transporter [Anaerolineales bacterium]